MSTTEARVPGPPPAWKVVVKLRGMPGLGDLDRLVAALPEAAGEETADGMGITFRIHAVDLASALVLGTDMLSLARDKVGVAPGLLAETTAEIEDGCSVDPSAAMRWHLVAAVEQIGMISKGCERLRVHVEAAGQHTKTLGRHVNDRIEGTAADIHALQSLAFDLIQTLAELEAGSRG